MRASKARTFYFYRSTIAPPPPFAPCWRELVARAYYCTIYPLWGRGMFIHIVGTIGKSPSRNKTFQAASFIFIEARLRHLPPFEGSPRAGAAEYVLRGDVYSHCKSPSRNKTSQTASFYFYRSTIASPPPFEGSPRAGAAEYVLRGDVYSHCKSPPRNKTSQTASFIFIEARLRHIVGAIGKSPAGASL